MSSFFDQEPATDDPVAARAAFARLVLTLVDGDVVDPERWFERNKQAMGNAVLAELEDRLAW
jgi:hypothetical protein